MEEVTTALFIGKAGKHLEIALPARQAILKKGKKMKKVIYLLIVLVISFVFVPEAFAFKEEKWGLILNDGQVSGDCTLTEQNGTITANGTWDYQGGTAWGSYTDAPVAIAGSSISITASGMAINPFLGYPFSEFTLTISGRACNGHGSGIFTMTFDNPEWSGISGSWKGIRISGSGITAVAIPWTPLLMLDD